MKRLVLSVLACLCCLGGCSRGLVVIPDDAHSLEQYSLGLKYKQEGRYLLARESFQLAKATARNPDMRSQADRELAAVERAIKDLR
ncbi:hypothetical protein JCM15519_32800 [Fundidesulfovibrio butyratiphilus]